MPNNIGGEIMKAEIIAVGTEILLGDIVNTNAQYIARRLADIGINVYYQTAVGDNPDRVREAYKLAFSRADMVITTGGLGPTKDDLTKEAGAEYFNRKMYLHEPSYELLVQFFKKRDMTVSESNRKQALMPENSIVLPNDHGTAPGCIIEDADKVLVMMPGPPREMKPMFENHVIPYLKKYEKGVLLSKVLRICGIGESAMAEKIDDIIEGQTNPTVAPYAKEGEVTLRITARAEDASEAEKIIEPVETEIRNRLGEDIYGTGEKPLEYVLAEKIIKKNLTIATAESCTGGLLAGKIINYPGISKVYLEGAVTYSNEAKMRNLGVSEDTLTKHGAVSHETAAEMARGIAERAGTDIGLSTTGIAGPDGGTEEKPVGLVYLGLYIKGEVKTKRLDLWGDRQKVRERAVISAIDWLRREVDKVK